MTGKSAGNNYSTAVVSVISVCQCVSAQGGGDSNTPFSFPPLPLFFSSSLPTSETLHLESCFESKGEVHPHKYFPYSALSFTHTHTHTHIHTHA